MRKNFKLRYDFVDHAIRLENGELFAHLSDRITSEEVYHTLDIFNNKDESCKIAYNRGYDEAGEEFMNIL